MTAHKVWLGSSGPYPYDDENGINNSAGNLVGANSQGVSTTGQINVAGVPVEDYHVLRKADLGTLISAPNILLAAIAALTTAADRLLYFTGLNTPALAIFTAAARALLDDADAAAMRTTLGLAIGTNVQAYNAALSTIAGTISAFALTLIDDADSTAARTTLGLTIGTNIQAYDAMLSALAALTTAADQMLYFTGADTPALSTLSSFARTLLDDADASTARTTLGITTPANVITAIGILVSDPQGSAITTGDGKAYVRIPSTLTGQNLIGVAGHVSTVSSSGVVTVQIRNATDSVDMLSTALTIDASEKDSSTAAAAAVINAANDDVATGDEIEIDIDGAGTGTKGLFIELQFQLP
jgi:hypothetical protein